MGPVTNVVLFDKEADGVASVRYGNAEAAKACVSVCALFNSLILIRALVRESGYCPAPLISA